MIYGYIEFQLVLPCVYVNSCFSVMMAALRLLYSALVMYCAMCKFMFMMYLIPTMSALDSKSKQE